jgi:hypothetical protein
MRVQVSTQRMKYDRAFLFEQVALLLGVNNCLDGPRVKSGVASAVRNSFKGVDVDSLS